MKPIYAGTAPLHTETGEIEGVFTEILGEPHITIRNYDGLDPFFITLISSSDHWLFLSSHGGLTAGRVDAEKALFPYYTEDKLRDFREHTGSKTILMVSQGEHTSLWEPFSDRFAGAYRTRRALYKNISGSSIVFEEHNLDLELAFRYAWRFSDTFGLVRTAWLTNTGPASCRIELLDGVQNLLPANVGSSTQNAFSVLLDAYKRAELHEETGVGVFSLSSILTDRAEPSESLLATTAAQVGLNPDAYLLSSHQLDRFREGRGVEQEVDVRGRRGAYFAHARMDLASGQSHVWYLVLEVAQDHVSLTRLIEAWKQLASARIRVVEADVRENQRRLWELVALADGLQMTASTTTSWHHFANTLFNIMRGGVFPDQYRIRREALKQYIHTHNRTLSREAARVLDTLPEDFPLRELRRAAGKSDSLDVRRLCATYLPLTFSRRHGDPSRPWNRFSIQVRHPDGRRKYGYEGNWRDIFQNWEALAHSYPEFIEGMIGTFLNATTPDGYNPYRITQNGVDWEVPEPDNPWSNIGYWSDHQIIYLLKLLEASRNMHPGRLEGLLDQRAFTYANVPYRIAPYEAILENPYDTIQYDWDLSETLEKRVAEVGSDGVLVCDPDGAIHYGSLVEKLLSLLLAKLVNFVPEGGIWMNTQRPEWNDANNALVGRGLSVVTLGYLRRFTMFFLELVPEAGGLQIGEDYLEVLRHIQRVFTDHRGHLETGFDDRSRRRVMDDLGAVGSAFRQKVYSSGLSPIRQELPASELAGFLKHVLEYIDQSLRANRMESGLFHAYNILHLGSGEAQIDRLELMLEGQVSILSSGLLSGEEVVTLLEALRASDLYRSDQHSYLLYPDRSLKGFLEKNRLPAEAINGLRLIQVMTEQGDERLITRDMRGAYHFNGAFRNAADVRRVLSELREDPDLTDLVEAEAGRILDLFEQVFQHARFTGRAGTFFAYEGLGSIYWHMVGKLLLAVQENALRFQDGETGRRLREAYFDIRAGLGFNKTPAEFGAFPTDPYSHTPVGRGAQQPGMTGLVKEEILTRQAELGAFFREGRIVFDFTLFDQEELLLEGGEFVYLDVSGAERRIHLEPGSLAYTVCQVPVVLVENGAPGIRVYRDDGVQEIAGHALDEETSLEIMIRSGAVRQLVVQI